ncbi:MAG: Zn-dependent alcohol dehydrogenase [Actinomycetota bacterium]|nr:Zn-dependent alcohol dehydrogenase [Actinomycetota bacterium]
MRAAVLREAPGELGIEDVAVDRPGSREVLIRTVAAGLCHSDLHFIDAAYPTKLPAVLGHESAGVVEAVGDEVTYVRPGDHVITCLAVYCGACEHCLTGRQAICQNKVATRRPREATPRLGSSDAPMHQFLDLSSFAEMMLVHEHAVVKIRDDMPLDRAALLGCGVTTGVGAVWNTAEVEPGTTVAVIGCGGIGLNCVQAARLAGATRVIAVDLLDEKLELATTFGATDLVNAGAVDPVVAVRELTGGGVDHSFEAIGLKVATEQAWRMLGPGGTATVVGMIPVGTKIELHGPDFLNERRIQGSAMGSTRFRVDMVRYVDLYLDGRLKLDELVSARIGLDAINDGFAKLRKGSVARSVITFDSRA